MSSALVVYESMYGNTREIAEAIAAGLGEGMDAKAVPVHLADAAEVDAAELLVVGGPTHVHGMASATSRKGTIQAAEEDGVELDASAHAKPTLRAWLADRSGDGRRAAAFDTRIDRSPLLTGSAARGIAKRLRRRGYALATDSKSFFVDDSEGPLAEGEVERARKWGAGLARLDAGEVAVSTVT
jgi:flavodoxin